MTENEASGETAACGKCGVCGRRFRLIVTGELRAHGKPANRCPGSGCDPEPSILIRGDEEGWGGTI